RGNSDNQATRTFCPRFRRRKRRQPGRHGCRGERIFAYTLFACPITQTECSLGKWSRRRIAQKQQIRLRKASVDHGIPQYPAARDRHAKRNISRSPDITDYFPFWKILSKSRRATFPNANLDWTHDSRRREHRTRRARVRIDRWRRRWPLRPSE